MPSRLPFAIDGSAFWPGMLVFLVALLFATAMFFGFSVALYRGVRTERRRVRSQRDRFTP